MLRHRFPARVRTRPCRSTARMGGKLGEDGSILQLEVAPVARLDADVGLELREGSAHGAGDRPSNLDLVRRQNTSKRLRGLTQMVRLECEYYGVAAIAPGTERLPFVGDGFPAASSFRASRDLDAAPLSLLHFLERQGQDA